MDPFRSRLEQALVGQYRFVRELGGGGMSRTYLADEPALQRRVVVKVLAPEMLEGLSVERFKREVLLAASLQHPHVVPVLAAGDADGLPWFSMPYVDGESLRQRLAQGPLAIGEAVAILRDVARALRYAHAQGIVHRDIKPDNVLLSAGSATVTDFGIAKAITASRQGTGGATLTQVGLAIGTPAYMAPEQAEGASDIDHRADLYAFGAMAFELLTGQPVFAATTPGRLLVSHITEAPRDPRSLRPDIPTPLAELVLRCLAKAPGDRPADAEALVRALDGAASMDGTTPVRLPASTLPIGAALGTWAAGSAVLVGGVFVAGKAFGVPSWAMPSAVTLSVAGLPALLGAWWVQRTAAQAVTRTPTMTPGGSRAPIGTMATLALRAQPHVTLRRTRRLGAAVTVAFALLIGGFMASRAYGIGPAASLIGSGEFKARESVMVADFRPPANDTTLGVTVAEALRTDLGQSPNLAVLTRAAVREVLQRMQRPVDTPVPFDLAREIATREGTKAVIDGDVVRLGTSYVLSARLVSAVDGRELATFRETAENDAALVPAVGQLSRSIREKVGESLKGLGAAKPLERVSTPSLAALRKYVEGMRLEELGGDRALALQRLQEAVALDSGFAMAWRKIAVMYTLLPNARAQTVDAASRAYRFRDRLSDDERDLTDAAYYTYGPAPSPEKVAAAYEQILSRDSLNSTALNNLAVQYSETRQIDKAISLYLRAASLPQPSAVSVINLASNASRFGNRQALDSAVRLFALRFPGSRQQWEVTAYRLLAAGRSDSLAALTRQWMDSAQSPRQMNLSGNYLTAYEASRGRISASLSASASREAGLARLAKRAPQRIAVLVDSARAAGLYDGDRARTREVLQRLLSPATLASTAPAERPWAVASAIAALAGDAASADALLTAYRRDNAAIARDPIWESARVEGHTALAKGQFREAIAQLQQAARRKTAADVEEAFLIAMAFDRAGTPDSAITWFTTALDPTKDQLGAAVFYRAAAERRLAELLDAKGDVAGAITHYEQFATLWKDAEPSRQPLVKAARDRIAQLRARKDPG